MVTNKDTLRMHFSNHNRQPAQEKPRHLKYINEFRTRQCPLFLQQQCQFHRPYTCFYWHFPNQKRRRPFKKPDGTFNYNPDVYCDTYDESSGTCAYGDDCVYAHKNASDSERRYHPRYFKTGQCVYETTETGACVKNGLHCAFAHGPDDLRMPVFDVRESLLHDGSASLPACLEKERVLSEDPKWNEMFHVLANYKTELCQKPPRMCRQGYSCPYYHNGKDKRRAPALWHYRSTPCPAVRPGDEWLDSALCRAGDSCLCCHTRTEQQFHPEIYKSTRCNDVLTSGYCPRGSFCAFAHLDSELTIGRDYLVGLGQQQQPSPGSRLSMASQAAFSGNNNNGHPQLLSPGHSMMLTSTPVGQNFGSRPRRFSRHCSSPPPALGQPQANWPQMSSSNHQQQQQLTSSSVPGFSAPRPPMRLVSPSAAQQQRNNGDLGGGGRMRHQSAMIAPPASSGGQVMFNPPPPPGMFNPQQQHQQHLAAPFHMMTHPPPLMPPSFTCGGGDHSSSVSSSSPQGRFVTRQQRPTAQPASLSLTTSRPMLIGGGNQQQQQHGGNSNRLAQQQHQAASAAMNLELSGSGGWLGPVGGAHPGFANPAASLWSGPGPDLMTSSPPPFAASPDGGSSSSSSLWPPAPPPSSRQTHWHLSSSAGTSGVGQFESPSMDSGIGSEHHQLTSSTVGAPTRLLHHMNQQQHQQQNRIAACPSDHQSGDEFQVGSNDGSSAWSPPDLFGLSTNALPYAVLGRSGDEGAVGVGSRPIFSSSSSAYPGHPRLAAPVFDLDEDGDDGTAAADRRFWPLEGIDSDDRRQQQQQSSSSVFDFDFTGGLSPLSSSSRPCCVEEEDSQRQFWLSEPSVGGDGSMLIKRDQSSMRAKSLSYGHASFNLPSNLLSNGRSGGGDAVVGGDLPSLVTGTQLQRELDTIRHHLDSKEDELVSVKRDRDTVAEQLRDSLSVIQCLVDSFGTLKSTDDDDASSLPTEPLQQRKAALASLYANPLIDSLLQGHCSRSSTSPAADQVTSSQWPNTSDQAATAVEAFQFASAGGEPLPSSASGSDRQSASTE